MKTGWCIDGDNPVYYGHEPNMELHDACRNGQSVGSRTIECDCWHHKGTKFKRSSTQVKRNGRTTKKAKETKVVKSKAGKKGYSKNGKKLGRPKGSKNRVKVKAV